ncbi:hypothetical protein E2C01_055916 [Portunus trituberculatus]|uniref:Uncharacterized protein n=1 Tax=Portunus trituberculatus TaxID=210409 RepID=A0A5B7GWH9_PORTR|nr:hypothetical protein [Portunus trituberculatus]
MKGGGQNGSEALFPIYTTACVGDVIHEATLTMGFFLDHHSRLVVVVVVVLAAAQHLATASPKEHNANLVCKLSVQCLLRLHVAMGNQQECVWRRASAHNLSRPHVSPAPVAKTAVVNTQCVTPSLETGLRGAFAEERTPDKE